MDTEEFEQIPWSQLVGDVDDGRRRTLYVIAGVIMALVVGVVAARSLRGPAPTVVTLPAAAPATDSAGEGVTTTAGGPPAPETVIEPAQAPQPLTEADLMAVFPEEATRIAAAAAEIFVTEYFTVDGAAASSDRLRVLVPGNLEVAYPQDSPTDAMSYVEWARAVRAEQRGEGRHTITVLYGSVAAADDGAIHRLPVRAVGVDVVSGPGEIARVAGLPRPVDVPTGRGLDVRMGEPPASVVAGALDIAAGLGDQASVVTAYQHATGWDVVVLITDPDSGIRWPLAISMESGP